MATSGTFAYSRTAGQIITSAYEDLKVIVPGGTVAAADSVMALSRLNMIVKQYQGKSDSAPGIKVHTRQRITLFLAKGQHTYLVGPSSTDARATTKHGRTTIRAAEAAGQTVLDVTALTDTTTYSGTTVTMGPQDVIGIQTDDAGGDDIFWTTISSVSTTGPTVTIADALPTARPAASGNYVWWFSARAQRFPETEAAVLRNSSLNDTPLGVYKDVRQYDSGIASKYADGTPTDVLIEPLRTATRITLNSQPTDVTDTIVLTVLYPAENYDATADDIAFPQEAFRFLSWELAFALSPAVGRWTPEMEKNRNEARSMYLNLNPENSVLYFQPNA
mgnify:CR=1 FL=1